MLPAGQDRLHGVSSVSTADERSSMWIERKRFSTKSSSSPDYTMFRKEVIQKICGPHPGIVKWAKLRNGCTHHHTAHTIDYWTRIHRESGGVDRGLQVLNMNVQRFQGGLVSNAHGPLYHSTVVLKATEKKKTTKGVTGASLVRSNRLQGYLAYKKAPRP